MKNSKFRMLAVALAAVISVGLASCGDSDSSTEESKASEETSSASAAAADSSSPEAAESTGL